MVRERQKNNGGVWGVRSDEFKKGDKENDKSRKNKGAIKEISSGH